MRKTIVFTEANSAELKSEKLPEPAPGECVIRNDLTLISPGTELALFTGTHIGFKDPEITWAAYPLVPGYASEGTVEYAPDGSSLKKGDRVMYYGPHSTHGIINPEKDIWSMTGKENSGKSLFGRFAQISGTVPYLAKENSGNVLVLGAGLIGNFCAQIFSLEKERTVLIADISGKRLNLAESCGLVNTVNTAEEDLSEAVSRLTDGKGVDIVVEATGVPELIPAALAVVNPLGKVYLLGSTRGDVSLNVYKYIHRKGVSLIGAHESVPGIFPGTDPLTYNRSALARMIAMIEDGQLKTEGMITHRIKPEEAQEYYNHLLNDRDNYLGVLIDWRTA